MNHDSGYNDPFRDDFNLHSRFISNYLSVQIRKLKFLTDGTFNMIAVSPTLDVKHVCRIVGEKALDASIFFNRREYEKLTEIEKYECYLDLLQKGYSICSQYKNIPLEPLLKLHQDFRDNNYKNEWLHKKRKFKEVGIEVDLYCYFTSHYFELEIIVYDIKNKEILISGTVIRTLPNEVCFDYLFKDIVINDDYLSITSFNNKPKFSFLLDDIHRKKFSFEVLDNGVDYIKL